MVERRKVNTSQAGIICNSAWFIWIFVFACVFHGKHSIAQQLDTPATVGIVTGVGYGQLKNNNTSDKEFVFEPSFTRLAGLTVEIPIPRLERKGTFYSELSFSQFEATSSLHIPYDSPANPDSNYKEINQWFAPNLLSVSTMFRYCFTNGNLKYYIGAGVYNSFVISPRNRKTTIDHKNGIPKSTVEETVPDYSVHGIMLLVSTGLTYKYAGIEFRYDPGRNYTRKIDYSVYNPTISVFLHFRFNP